MSDTTHTARVTIGTERYDSTAQTDGHTLHADEPESLGGTDAGPTPYGYLLTALGACKTITCRMYADRKEWPLEGVAVDVEHERLPDRTEVIRVRVALAGELTDEQRKRLFEIAGRCPVHRTIADGVRIESTLV